MAAVIERLTGVRYHPGHVWKILGAMKWRLQRPAKQAKERNEQARQQWVAERWPAAKKNQAPPSGVDPRVQLEEAAGLRGPANLLR